MRYTKREHDQAIEEHNRRYAEMKRAAREHGREGDEYRQARAAVVQAACDVRRAARRPGRGVRHG
jgi:hypothetical protein